jgi:small subunit ribosomal protein S2
MSSIDKMATDGTFDNLSKREKLQVGRQRAKLEKNLGSIADLTRLPAALFVVDISKEHIAVREAKRLNIPVFAMVDTNSDPNQVDFPIPSNDDASNSISLIVGTIAKSIQEGLDERKSDRDKEESEKSDKEGKSDKTKTKSRRSFDRIDSKLEGEGEEDGVVKFAKAKFDPKKKPAPRKRKED